jgi:hypothetical protein
MTGEKVLRPGNSQSSTKYSTNEAAMATLNSKLWLIRKAEGTGHQNNNNRYIYQLLFVDKDGGVA